MFFSLVRGFVIYDCQTIRGLTKKLGGNPSLRSIHNTEDISIFVCEYYTTFISEPSRTSKPLPGDLICDGIVGTTGHENRVRQDQERFIRIGF